MTAAFAVVSTTPASDAPSPLPWRRMAWVTWRQHRVALLGALGFVAVLALLLLVAGLRLHHAYAAVLSCRPVNSFSCGQLARGFVGVNGFLSNGFVLQALPPLIGVLVGAPLIAREFESRTFRFAWTQGYGRARWAIAKLVGIAVLLAGLSALFGLLVSWYYQPYLATGNGPLWTSQASPLNPGLFDLRGTAIAAWTVLAFAIGACSGAVLRRVVPANVASLVLYAAIAFAVGGFLRERYLAPVLTRSLDLGTSAWVLSQQWFTSAGRPASNAAINQALQFAPGGSLGKGSVPKSTTVWGYLVHHGFMLRTTFQPASRFWTFQGVETGWLLVLSGLLVATTLWVVVRRSN